MTVDWEGRPFGRLFLLVHGSSLAGFGAPRPTHQDVKGRVRAAEGSFNVIMGNDLSRLLTPS